MRTRAPTIDNVVLSRDARPVGPRAKLGIFAGSGPFDPERFERGVERLSTFGFDVVRAPGIEAQTGFLAGSDEHRAEGFRWLLECAEIDALIAARGGYGLTRILDRLDPGRFATADLRVVGFSDVTALHTHLLSHGLSSWHGPVVTQLPTLPEADLAALESGLRGDPIAPVEAEGPVLSGGRAEGPLWGGNLAVFAALVGTPALRLPTEPVVLLLEDVGETTYRIDRTLTHLRSAGVLDRVAGVALGDFIDCRAAQPSHPGVLEVLEERLGSLGIPVLAGIPVGHGRRNRLLPLGRRVLLDTHRQRLEVLP